MGDHCSKSGAARLTERLADHWAELGYTVEAEVVQGPFMASLRAARVDVRSDMLNGCPRDHPGNGGGS